MQRTLVGGDVTARPHRWVLLTAAASYEDYALKNPTGSLTPVDDAFTRRPILTPNADRPR